MLQPDYASIIIAGILNNGAVDWLVADRELFTMNEAKLPWGVSAELHAAHLARVLPLRGGIVDLGKVDAESVKNAYVRYNVNIEDLRNGFVAMLRNDKREAWSYVPSLVLDYDTRTFWDCSAEPFSYSEAVSEGWRYSNEDLTKCVPTSDAYWLVGERNLLMELN